MGVFLAHQAVRLPISNTVSVGVVVLKSLDVELMKMDRFRRYISA